MKCSPVAVRGNARVSLLAAIAATWLLSPLGDARAAAPAARFSSAERVALPAVAGSRVKNLPRQIKKFGRSSLGVRWGLNPTEARAVVAPDVPGQTWYVVPGRRGVCLMSLGTGTCQTIARALKGNLYLQAVQPSSSSPDSPLAPGSPVMSRIVGLAPYGTISVSAPTKSGAVVNGVLKSGVYAISGTDMTSVMLARAPLVAPVFSG